MLLFVDQCAGSMPRHWMHSLCLCHTDMTHTPGSPFNLCLLIEIDRIHMCTCHAYVRPAAWVMMQAVSIIYALICMLAPMHA